MGNEFVGKAHSPSDWRTTPRSTCPAFRRSFACQRSERVIERVSRGKRRRHHTDSVSFASLDCTGYCTDCLHLPSTGAYGR